MLNLALKEAIRAVRTAWPDARPESGVILGTGWLNATPEARTFGVLAYDQIPALGAPTVAGHAGRLHWMTFGGRECFVFEGRRHWYEGLGWNPVAVPIAILRAVGVKRVLLTCSAGALRNDWHAGDLILIEDHIHAMGAHPLVGPHDPFWGPRFPDLSQVYSRRLNRGLLEAAARAGFSLAQGVYLAVSGPCFETPAEVAAFRRFGADLVGMSIAPEAALAHTAGLEVAALACITNVAGTETALAHENVLDTARRAMPRARLLIETFLRDVTEET